MYIKSSQREGKSTRLFQARLLDFNLPNDLKEKNILRVYLEN